MFERGITESQHLMKLLRWCHERPGITLEKLGFQRENQAVLRRILKTGTRISVCRALLEAGPFGGRQAGYT